MKKNDVYICSASLLPVSEYDNERLVVIRDFDKYNVKFSFCNDDQPNLCLGIMKAANITFHDVMFLKSAFTVEKNFFEECFTKVGQVVPYMEEEGGQDHE